MNTYIYRLPVQTEGYDNTETGLSLQPPEDDADLLKYEENLENALIRYLQDTSAANQNLDDFLVSDEDLKESNPKDFRFPLPFQSKKVPQKG